MITWEWAVVVVATILFFSGIEAWKFAKRVYFRRQAAKNTEPSPLSHASSQEKGSLDVEKGEVEGRGGE